LRTHPRLYRNAFAHSRVVNIKFIYINIFAHVSSTADSRGLEVLAKGEN